VQEVAALIMAQGIVARIRSAVATRGKVPTLRVSFAKTLRHVQALFLMAALGGGIFSQAQFCPLSLCSLKQGSKNELAGAGGKRERACWGGRQTRQDLSHEAAWAG
jgi:hypothetical protein